MKIVFMGTPDFAVPCLEALIASPHTVAGVFCQPDKPKGRGYAMTPPPVKVCAAANEIPVFQPKTLKDGEALQILREISPDLIVVVAYGKILPPEILTLPRCGCINMHASLLPRYRGAAPIQWSVLNGETKTGVTSMQMDAGLDTGDMLLQRETEIPSDMTAGELHDVLSAIGAELLTDTLAALEAGTLSPVKQDDALSCYAPMLSKELCPVDWTRTAREIHNQIRGLSPWPVATTKFNGKTVKLHAARVADGKGEPGTVLESGKQLIVACADGAIEILTLQPEGKKAMAAADYLRGTPIASGTRLGD